MSSGTSGSRAAGVIGALVVAAACHACGASDGGARAAARPDRSAAAPTRAAAPAPIPADPRYDGTLAEVRALALELARAPARAADPTLPRWLRGLDYDQSRAIRFRPEASLWRGDDRRFEVQFFHRTPFSRDPVSVVEVLEDGRARPVPFDPARFDLPAGVAPPRPDPDLGFAGFRAHGPMHGPTYLDEVVVFLGASYFRSLGARQHYGTSARGLAIDTGLPSGEEFPRFTRFWLLRPAAGDAAAPLRVVALLESARATGAFGFTVVLEGDQTRIDVDARLHLRGPIAGLGLAPMSSMFLFGEADPARFGDFRPEVHDADGLAVAAANGERLWRPLTNPATTRLSDFAFDGVEGFGLVQRDRDFDHYQDLEARYDRRPDVWVTPRGAWGPGSVRLLEIATTLETDDNVALGWVPSAVPTSPGVPLDVAYTVHFGALDSLRPPWFVTATRVATGAPDGSARFFVELEGAGLAALDPSALELVVTATPDGARVDTVRVERLPPAASGAGRVRGSFDVHAEGPVELRAFLRGDGRASETWTYAWVPPR